jgi:membrane fusion protein (multidrug efflux system)
VTLVLPQAKISGIFLVLALCAASLASCSSSDDKAQVAPEAGYIVMKAETVPLFVELPGRTAPYEVSEVRPQVSGVVKAKLFTEGSVVRAGETLYQIDPSLYRAALDQASANLANAEANRAAMQARADRYRPLVKIEAVSQQDFADADATAKQAVASVAQSRATLQTARINLAFTRVPAPITGRVGRALVTTGALVTTNQTEPLTTIQRLDPIYVDIQQSSADLLALRRSLSAGGMTPSSTEVRLRLEDNSEYPLSGTLQFAEAMVDPNTGTVTLRARFPNPSGLLLPGMYVRARLSQATAQNAILAPQSAVSRDAKGEATIMLVGPGDKAVLRTVTADRTISDKWLITKGLKAGDKVIVEGLVKIHPDQPVRPVPAGSKAPSKPAESQGARS